MTSNNFEHLPHGRGYECEPGLVCGHLPLQRQHATIPSVLLKLANFRDGLTVQYCERLQRSANPHHRPFAHLKDYRYPLDFCGIRDFKRMHWFPSNHRQSLSQPQRDAKEFVPERKLIFRVAQ